MSVKHPYTLPAKEFTIVVPVSGNKWVRDRFLNPREPLDADDVMWQLPETEETEP